MYQERKASVACQVSGLKACSKKLKTRQKYVGCSLFYEVACSTLTDRLTLAATHPRDSPTRPVTNTLDTDRSVLGECKSLWRPGLVPDCESAPDDPRTEAQTFVPLETKDRNSNPNVWKLSPLLTSCIYRMCSRQTQWLNRVDRQVLIPDMKVKVETISFLNSEKTAVCSKSGDSLLLHHQCCTTCLTEVSRRSIIEAVEQFKVWQEISCSPSRGFWENRQFLEDEQVQNLVESWVI